MAVQRHYETVTAVASQDLTGHQFKAVANNGGVAGTSALALGILQTKPAANDHMTVGYKGQMKAYIGAAVSSGAQLGVAASGFLITVTTSEYVGIALESGASGDLITGLFDFQMGKIA